MDRLTVIFTSLLVVAAWSPPIDATADQGRAKRRDPGTTQAQPAPRRGAPARRAPSRTTADPTGDTRNRPITAPANTGGSDRAAANGDRRRPGRVRVGSPSTGSRAVAGRAGRSNGRGASVSRAGNTRQGTAQVNRRPPRGPVVGTAVARPRGSSRPVRTTGRRGVRVYTPYLGRYRTGVPRIYGNRFYFPGYSTFNIGVRYGSSYLYDPYWYGYYGSGSSYNPYAYSRYDRDYYTGSLRVKVRPQSAEVIVDGYYVGVVNDYDGIFQRLRLEEGPHHVEIAERGFETLVFDVRILPGETITYGGDLVPLP